VRYHHTTQISNIVIIILCTRGYNDFDDDDGWVSETETLRCFLPPSSSLLCSTWYNSFLMILIFRDFLLFFVTLVRISTLLEFSSYYYICAYCLLLFLLLMLLLLLLFLPRIQPVLIMMISKGGFKLRM